MELQLIDINPETFGLNNDTADSIIKDLPSILEERKPLADQYNEVIRMDIENPATAKRAKEVRLLIKNNRTKGIEAWHKATKEFFLKGGQFIDAIKRKEIAENERMEEALEKIEKHQEIKEKQRIDALQSERIEIIKQYVDDTTGLQLGVMEQDMFEAFLSAKKAAYNDRIAQQQREEEERKAKQLAEENERKRLKEENDRLLKEAEEKQQLLKKRSAELQPYLLFIRDYSDLMTKEETEYQKEFSEIKNAAEQQWQLEEEEAKKNHELFQAYKKKAVEFLELHNYTVTDEGATAKSYQHFIGNSSFSFMKTDSELTEFINRVNVQIDLENQKRENKRLAEQEQLKQQEELRKKKEAEELAKAPVKTQLKEWIKQFQIPPISIEHDMRKEIEEKFEAFKNWANTKIDSI